MPLNPDYDVLWDGTVEFLQTYEYDGRPLPQPLETLLEEMGEYINEAYKGAIRSFNLEDVRIAYTTALRSRKMRKGHWVYPEESPLL